MKSYSFVVFIVLSGMVGVLLGGCTSGSSVPDGDSDSSDSDSIDGDLEPDKETSDPCSGATVDCRPGTCVLHDNEAACICPDGYHAEHYSCQADAPPDGDTTENDEVDGDLDSSEDGDYEWPEYDNWPTPIPWYDDLEVKPYDPENPDPNCEQDPHYPGNSTKEGAILLESGARLTNMSVCEIGDEDWYELSLGDNDFAVIRKSYRADILGTGRKSRLNNESSQNDLENWTSQIDIFSYKATYLLARRKIQDAAQYYSFGVDFYKNVDMPSNPDYPTPLPSNHYLLARHPRAIQNEFYPPCLDIDAHHNENNTPGFGMIRLVYRSQADHVISMILDPASYVSLLADCRDPDSVLACLSGNGDGQFMIRTSDYAQRPACIAIGTLIYIEQTTAMVRILFVEENNE
jgi:hypothetical protein